MKLCVSCASTVSIIDIITQSERYKARLCKEGESCDDCKEVYNETK